MTTDWNAIRLKKEELLEAIPQETKDKYMDVAGIYAIYIENELVYVGMSTNLLNRWVAHKINTLFDYGQKDYKEEKYAVLRDAMAAGLAISCNVLEFCENNKYTLRSKENEWIRKLNPALNGGRNQMVYLKGSRILDKLKNK